jgi:DNA polymerase III epsilon subunit-like protein
MTRTTAYGKRDVLEAIAQLSRERRREVFIIVDIEAAGPSPTNYAMLAIGACTLTHPRSTFYVELQPDRECATEEALAVAGLSLSALAAEGVPVRDAMVRFADWLAQVVPDGAIPVMTALNAPFDWMFVNDYFHRYLGRNPFGHAALDIKAYCMGASGVSWQETSYRELRQRYLPDKPLAHNALEDAIDEAELFDAVLADRIASNRSDEEA